MRELRQRRRRRRGCSIHKKRRNERSRAQSRGGGKKGSAVLQIHPQNLRGDLARFNSDARHALSVTVGGALRPDNRNARPSNSTNNKAEKPSPDHSGAKIL